MQCARDRVNVELPDSCTVAVACVRNPRAKRIKLSVNERGARLTLPLRTPLATGVQFVHQHRDWLAAQFNASQHAVVPLLREKTTHLPLRGTALPLDWEPGRFVRLRCESGTLHFQLPDAVKHGALIRAVRDFYVAQARADIARWLPKYIPGLPRPPSRIQLRLTSSQWGSLSANGCLNLDLALVLAEPFAFEYVLVHELCHLLHHNHSPQFWNEVQTRCPDWRSARDYLRVHGRGLKAQMYALVA